MNDTPFWGTRSWFANKRMTVTNDDSAPLIVTVHDILYHVPAEKSRADFSTSAVSPFPSAAALPYKRVLLKPAPLSYIVPGFCQKCLSYSVLYYSMNFPVCQDRFFRILLETSRNIYSGSCPPSFTVCISALMLSTDVWSGCITYNAVPGME